MIDNKGRGKKSETKRNPRRRHSIQGGRKTQTEEEISKQLSKTAALLSNSSMSISIDSDPIWTPHDKLLEYDRGEGIKEEKLSLFIEEDTEEIKRNEKRLLIKTFISLDLCQ